MLFDLLPKQWQLALPESKRILDDLQLEDPFIPSRERIFLAFEQPISEIKVCIIGQDPYPNPEHAMGLAFSVPREIKILPPTLRNIFKELESDVGRAPSNGDLTEWQNRGVMLLNTSLTTIPKLSQGHSKLGWAEFTNQVVTHLGTLPIVFILWGKNAAALQQYIPEGNSIVGVHPSPLSSYRGFFGSKPFSNANRRLAELGISSVDWKI
jgi:uracil-DNA glycosylase